MEIPKDTMIELLRERGRAEQAQPAGLGTAGDRRLGWLGDTLGGL